MTVSDATQTPEADVSLPGRLLRPLALGVIGVWRYGLAPLTAALVAAPSACRFEPSCSAYAAQAVRRHGGIRGSILAFKRIARCHPWGHAGHDPVPDSLSAAKTKEASR